MTRKHISRLKHILSYLFEQSIENTASDINPTLEVTYSKGQFKLSTTNANYSFGVYYTAFRQSFDQLQINIK